eukprot:TRINITY_DN102712_c0_g1_i1.p1 TRINITY_DN102712_c0_g1~~TRINITY_DN102712_c0_g1_i1.p1  ORF type:complete len:894 (+),score=143.97 TRINITY_DN102712_c0_g1_i1:113-2794(+)
MIRKLSCFSVVTLCLVALTTPVLGGRADEHRHEEQRPLEALLQQVLGQGAQLEVDSMEADLQTAYRTLPKLEQDTVGPDALRYIIACHLRSKYYMFFEGLEAHELWATPSQSPFDVRILERAPASIVQALHEHNFTAGGVSLREVALYATLLRRFALHRIMDVFEATFHLQQHKSTWKLSSRKVQKTLYVFLGLLNTLKTDKSLSGTELAVHVQEKFPRLLGRLVSAPTPSIRQLVDEELGRLNLEGSGINLNPFRSTVSWEHVWSIAERLVTRFGSWQNTECHAMKHTLGDLDEEHHGRVPLGKFYKTESAGDLNGVFTESLDFLRSISAIDDSVPDSPKVIVANYVYSIANSKNLLGEIGFTCKNECFDVIAHLERNFSAPSATPEVILELVAGIVPPSSLTQEPLGPVPAKLVEKLYSMADRQGGACKLHSRLFMQWLHYAFPLDCPYPQPFWRKKRKERDAFLNHAYVATEEDKAYHVSKANGAWHMNSPWLSQWSDEEVSVLHVERPPVQEDSRAETPVESDRTLQLLLFAVIASLLFSTVRRGSQILRQYRVAKADKLVEELISSDTAAKELPMRKRISSGAASSKCAKVKSRLSSADQKKEVKEDTKQDLPRTTPASHSPNADGPQHVSPVSPVQNAADNSKFPGEAASEASDDESVASGPQEDSGAQDSLEFDSYEASPQRHAALAEDPAHGHVSTSEKPLAEVQLEEQAQDAVLLPSESESNKDFGCSSTSAAASQESGDDATDSPSGVTVGLQESLFVGVQQTIERPPGLENVSEWPPELTDQEPPGLGFVAEKAPELMKLGQVMPVSFGFRPPPGLPPPEPGAQFPNFPLLYGASYVEDGNQRSHLDDSNIIPQSPTRQRMEGVLACWDAAEAQADLSVKFQ